MARRISGFDKKVGMRLKELRVHAGNSQSDVANALGISFQQIQKYERGVNRISAGRLREISDFFGISIREFISDLEEDNNTVGVPHLSETELRLIYRLRKVDGPTRESIVNLVLACAQSGEALRADVKSDQPA